MPRKYICRYEMPQLAKGRDDGMTMMRSTLHSCKLVVDKPRTCWASPPTRGGEWRLKEITSPRDGCSKYGVVTHLSKHHAFFLCGHHDCRRLRPAIYLGCRCTFWCPSIASQVLLLCNAAIAPPITRESHHISDRL